MGFWALVESFGQICHTCAVQEASRRTFEERPAVKRTDVDTYIEINEATGISIDVDRKISIGVRYWVSGVRYYV